MRTRQDTTKQINSLRYSSELAAADGRTKLHKTIRDIESERKDFLRTRARLPFGVSSLVKRTIESAINSGQDNYIDGVY